MAHRDIGAKAHFAKRLEEKVTKYEISALRRIMDMEWLHGMYVGFNTGSPQAVILLVFSFSLSPDLMSQDTQNTEIVDIGCVTNSGFDFPRFRREHISWAACDR